MPLIGTRGVASANAVGLFSSGGSNWLSTYATMQLNSPGASIACDSSGNLYAGGVDIAGLNYAIQVSKINPFGSLLWQKYISVSAPNEIYFYRPAIGADVNGNVYCFGSVMNTSTSSYFYYLTKLDATGSALWGKTLSNADGATRFRLTIDSAFNVIITSTTYNAINGSDIQIVKYNSSGVLQWQRSLRSVGFTQDRNGGVTTDSANNVYITGIADSNQPVVAKYNASGVLQWQRILSSTTLEPVSIGSDGTDVYILGGASSPSAPAYLFKYSSAGSLLWQRQLQVNRSTNDNGQIAVIGSDVYFCCGQGVGASPAPAVVAKYNSSGVIQWQRSIGVTDPSEGTEGTGAAVDSKGGLLLQLFGTGSVNASAIMARLPTNGTKTGTYALSTYNVAYTTTTFTESATSFTSSTSTYLDSATTFTDASLTPTVTNSSLSYIITQI